VDFFDIFEGIRNGREMEYVPQAGAGSLPYESDFRRTALGAGLDDHLAVIDPQALKKGKNHKP
jgi:hypothetical protein